MQSLLTAHFIGAMFSEKAKILTYEDVFESDTEEYKLKKLQQETAQLRELARKVNEQRRQSDGRRSET